MSGYDFIAYLIVFFAALYLFQPVIRKKLVPIMAQHALQRGKIKLAMKLRAISQKKTPNHEF